MSYRTQEDADEERVTVKSKPMMNLVSRFSARDPNVLASTASESLGKTKSESQVSLTSWNEQQPRTGRPVIGASSSDYPEWNIDDKWSSQEWKSGEMLWARTGRPVGGQQFTQDIDKFVIDDDDMDSDTVTEPNLSLKPTIILEQIERSISKEAVPIFKSCNARHRQTLLNLGNAHVFNIGSICVHGNFLIWKVDSWTIRWDFFYCYQSTGKIQTETIIHDQWWRRSHQSLVKRFTYFSDSVLCLGKVKQNPTSDSALEEKLSWFKSSS